MAALGVPREARAISILQAMRAASAGAEILRTEPVVREVKGGWRPAAAAALSRAVLAAASAAAVAADLE